MVDGGEAEGCRLTFERRGGLLIMCKRGLIWKEALKIAEAIAGNSLDSVVDSRRN
jgi:hypothetical protein